MTYGFDPAQPGAARLYELAQRIRRDHEPTSIEIVEPVLLPDQHVATRPGDRVTVGARLARLLVADGRARF
jgi:hypothetical protein